MAIQRTVTGPGKFTIGDTGAITVFDSQVTEIVLEPDISKGDARKVLSGETAPGSRTESWTLKGKILNDFGSTESRVEYCFEHRGQDLPFRFTPSTATGKEITGTLTVEPIAIGGEVGETPESDFEFLLIGEPVLGAVAGGE